MSSRPDLARHTIRNTARPKHSRRLPITKLVRGYIQVSRLFKSFTGHIFDKKFCWQHELKPDRNQDVKPSGRPKYHHKKEAARHDREAPTRQDKQLVERAPTTSSGRLRETGFRQAGEGRNSTDDCRLFEVAARQGHRRQSQARAEPADERPGAVRNR